MRIMPTGEVLDYLKARDEQLEALRQELNQAYQRIGQLEGVLQTRLLPDQEQELRQRLLEVEQARIALEEEVQQRAKPWWKRLFS
jgi:quinol monooxygenase YgiN